MTRARARAIIGRQLLAGMIGLLIVTVDACYQTARRRHPIPLGKVGKRDRQWSVFPSLAFS